MASVKTGKADTTNKKLQPNDLNKPGVVNNPANAGAVARAGSRRPGTNRAARRGR